MVVFLDSFGGSNELGAELLEAAEYRAPLNFFHSTNGLSDTFWCIFHHSEFHAGSVEVQMGGETQPMFGSVVIVYLRSTVEVLMLCLVYEWIRRILGYVYG